MSAPSFAGKWHNQYRSDMDLSIDHAGNVSGSYISRVPVVLPPMPVYGVIYGTDTEDDLIAFTVRWNGFDSITSWVGQVTRDENGIECLETIWHIVQNIADSDEPAKIYRQFLTGADRFYRGPSSPVPETFAIGFQPSHPLKKPAT